MTYHPLPTTVIPADFWDYLVIVRIKKGGHFLLLFPTLSNDTPIDRRLGNLGFNKNEFILFGEGKEDPKMATSLVNLLL